MHTHDNEERRALILLNEVFTKFTTQYNSDPTKTGLRVNDDGSFNVEIDKGPTFWFQNEIELGSWVAGIINAN